MSRRKSSRIRHYLRTLHPWLFLLIAIVFGVISLFALRTNNLKMVQLREAVYAADKAGNQTEIEHALRDLRTYIYGHMNTSLTSGTNAVHPPIQLQYTYERAQADHQSKLSQNNAGIYHEAQQSCASVTNGAAAIACIESYVTAHGVTLGDVPEGLYKFDFTSAKWSPDLAGWSIVIASSSLVIFGITSLRVWWIKRTR